MPPHPMAGPGPGGAHDYARYHRNFSAPHRFHAGAYHNPPGFYARRWVYGDYLSPAFFAPDYWISDYPDFGLMPPPFGTVWVRYGDDAILIDKYSGEVIQVEYNVFF